MIRRPPRPTLFPTTTLSRPRSPVQDRLATLAPDRVPARAGQRIAIGDLRLDVLWPPGDLPPLGDPNLQALVVHLRKGDLRSEEHTSELQSRQYLVCRLLLEK